MRNQIEAKVISFLNEELASDAFKTIEASSDLVQIIDWEKRHPDDGIPAFLYDFCSEFKIEVCHRPEKSKNPLLSKLVDWIPSSSLDVQYFYGLSVQKLNVADLITMANSKNWNSDILAKC